MMHLWEESALTSRSLGRCVLDAGGDYGEVFIMEVNGENFCRNLKVEMWSLEVYKSPFINESVKACMLFKLYCCSLFLATFIGFIDFNFIFILFIFMN